MFLVEGRFSDARDAIAHGLVDCNDAIAVIEEYAKLPNADEDLIDLSRPLFRIFPILFNGMDACVQADLVGYQGNIRKYKELLLSAVQAYRQAINLPKSTNPVFLTLVNMCTTVAGRLNTRRMMFAQWQQPRHVSPSGDKILIIHGHDEATRRELQTMLKNEFGLDVVVLKDQPSISQTLIEKFEKSADDCRYAFALLTPDDFIDKEAKSYFQARPNVLFELGWFYGHLAVIAFLSLRGVKLRYPRT